MLQPFNLKNKIMKIEHKKIFHGPHKNPPPLPPTYLMYGPLKET